MCWDWLPLRKVLGRTAILRLERGWASFPLPWFSLASVLVPFLRPAPWAKKGSQLVLHGMAGVRQVQAVSVQAASLALP